MTDKVRIGSLEVLPCDQARGETADSTPSPNPTTNMVGRMDFPGLRLAAALTLTPDARGYPHADPPQPRQGLATVSLIRGQAETVIT